MTSSAIDWAPLETMDGAGLRRVLQVPVDAWGEAWFGEPKARVEEPRLGRGHLRSPPEGGRWTPLAPRLALAITGRMRLAMAGMALGGGEALFVTEADRQIGEGLARRMTEDLAARLWAILAPGEAPDGPIATPLFDEMGGAMVAVRWAGDGERIWIAIPAALALVHLRDRPRADGSGRSPLAPRFRAVADQTATLDVILGAARLTPDELTHLAVGDVLVLDTALQGRVRLSRPGGGLELAARPKFEDSGIELKLEGAWGNSQ